MSELDKKQLKNWIDANVHDGEDRSGCDNDWIKFAPDGLQELIDDMYDDVIVPKLNAKDEEIKRYKQFVEEIYNHADRVGDYATIDRIEKLK